RPAGSNGQLATSDLCRVMNNQYLRADAAIALAALNEQYQARFGHAMCVTDGYRTLSTQYTLKATKGSLAATPGTSNHGWGLAIDMCPDTYQAWDKWNWLKENAPTYGWRNLAGRHGPMNHGTGNTQRVSKKWPHGKAGCPQS